MMTTTATEKRILDYWPFPHSKPRMTQEEVLAWMEKLPPEIRYIMCEVPVGGGKSPIALNYSGFRANGFGDAYILTPQKILQKQYEDSFDPKLLSSLYGRSNYTCEEKRTNCDIGSVVNPQCSACPYKAAFAKACYSPNIVLNYKLALLLFKYVASEKQIRRRKLMVFDEAHTLENHLTEFNALQVGEGRCKQFGVKWSLPKTMKDAYEWLKDTYVKSVNIKRQELAREKASIEESTAAGEQMSKHDVEIVKRFKDVSEHYETIMDYLLLGYQKLYDRYVYIPEKTHFRFKEIYGKHVFKDFVDNMADRFLFLSATILDKDAFCSDLGIDPKQTAFISMESEFPEEHRQIMYMPKAKMTYGWDTPERAQDRKDMVQAISEIAHVHADDNGIIHTASFQIAKWLVENLEGKVPHQIYHHNPDSGFKRDEVIDDFMNNADEKKILISPSITEGLDLKDELSRFAIFAKIPYPYMGDAWVKRRMELSKQWYSRQAIINMMQGSGRIVRSADDWGYIYILDESFGGLLNLTKKIVPKWWYDSIQRV